MPALWMAAISFAVCLCLWSYIHYQSCLELPNANSPQFVIMRFMTSLPTFTQKYDQCLCGASPALSLEKLCLIHMPTEMILLDLISKHVGSGVYHNSKLFSMSEFTILTHLHTVVLNWQPVTEDMKERNRAYEQRVSMAPSLHLFPALLGKWEMLQPPLTDALPQ